MIKILGETHDVNSWADALTVAIGVIFSDVDDHERIKEVSGRKRTYLIEEGQQSELVKPRQIPDTNLYLETNFSANEGWANTRPAYIIRALVLILSAEGQSPTT